MDNYNVMPSLNFHQLGDIVRIRNRFLKECHSDVNVANNSFFAGGVFKSAFLNLPIKDVDCFFHDYEAFQVAVDYLSLSDDCNIYYETKHVVAFILDGVVIECNRKIFGVPSDILNEFDFTVAKAALYNQTQDYVFDYGAGTPMFLYHPYFFEHIFMKRLVVDNKMPYPVSTYNRLFKYAKHGFLPCFETKAKLLAQMGVDATGLIMSMYEGID